MTPRQSQFDSSLRVDRLEVGVDLLYGTSVVAVQRIACADCYRWWDAISLASIATYGIYKNLKRKCWPFLKANEEEQNL